MQRVIDALEEPAAWPGADRRTLVVLASQLMAAGLYQEGFDYFAARLGTEVPAQRLAIRRSAEGGCVVQGDAVAWRRG